MNDVRFCSRSEVTCNLVGGDERRIADVTGLCVGKSPGSRDDDSFIQLFTRLISQGHGTPFEHAVMGFHLKAPIFVLRQIMRHRMVSWMEKSLRYTKAAPEFYIPYGIHPGIRSDMFGSIRSSWEIYLGLLDKGLSKEVARTVLPVSLMSEVDMTINLRSLLNFVSLRNSHHAQSTTQDLAGAVERHMERHFPNVMEAFNSPACNRNAP